MFYISVAIFSYFLVSLQTILDKFLLTTNRVSEPVTYAFYAGLMSIFTFILFPLGLHIISFTQFVMYVIPGIIFLYGIFCLFTAIEKNEASRIMPLVGAIIPTVTLFFSFVFLGEKLSSYEFFGVFLLIFGGIFISLEFYGQSFEPKKMFSGFYWTVSAGVLIATAYSTFKYFYLSDNFINVFIWTRMGLVIGALSFLIFPFWRKSILKSLREFKHPKKEEEKTGALFISNKILGGVASALTNYAISLGSVAVVNALTSVEYVFTFIIGLALSVKFPKIFQEKRTVRNILQKTLAICIVVAGIAMISIK